ncbi:nSTAND1 domain-containing NTPase [Nocardioides sp. MAHUQ-72]|uniref:nSTAND1 domain-containing NTPase n=1 Tax=unclassified Nocardioides TaxID=2615069 RepID=UPI0036223D1D
MGVAVLGPLRVDGRENGLSPRDRVVLSALVVRAGEPVTTEALADALWGAHLPATWTKVLQGCVVRLRKQLGSGAIVSAAHGYRLALAEDELDHKVFERLLERARDALAAGDPARSSYLARESLQLWRGRPVPDLEEWEPGRVETTRLEGLRMDAEELLVEAEIEAGRPTEVLERARALAAQSPLRERRWALLARALHLSGRQAEALGVITRARTILAEELGLDPGLELVALEAQLLRQDPSLSPATAPEVSTICPYRGLLPYDAADADTFFGREDDVALCLRRLRDAGTLAVVGPSGVGKSSLVRAGVVAALLGGDRPVLVTSPGTHPMDSIVDLKPRGRQVLVVDQAEEAVTLCADPAERSRYFAALAVHVGAGGPLVLALRADHLGDLAPYPEIARVLEEGLYLLGPLSEAGLRSAIEGPARRAGLRLEPGLVDLLVREVEGEPAALPLLSHVLRETWERREGPTLTVAGYRDTGGIRQAVTRSAETLYDAIDATQRTRLRSLLLRLVTPTEDGDPVRARVPRSKVAVDAAHARLVELLVEARLVSIDGDVLQIAHEALVRVWPRLRGWLDDDVDGQRLFRHLAGAAEAWESMGRPDSELYRGIRLTRTLEWRERAAPDLDDTENAFLDAAVALAAAERRAAETRAARERRASRRLRGALAGLGVLLVLALVAGVLAVRSAHQAGLDRERRQAAALLAEARRAGARAAEQEDLATSLLLAVEAGSVDASAQARDNLAAALTRAGPVSRVGEVGGATVSLSVSPDGRWVAVGMPTHQTRLFDARTLERVDFEETTPPSSIVGFSPDSHQLAVAVNQWRPDRQGRAPRIDDRPLRLYDVPGGTLSARQLGGLPEGSSIEYALDFSDDGRRLATVVQHWDRQTHRFTRLGTATVWDLAHPARPLFRTSVPEYADVALDHDGSRLYAAMRGPRPVRAYDVDKGRLLAVSPDVVAGYRGGGLDLSPDGSSLAVTTGDRVLRFDADTLRPREPAIRGIDLESATYSHDGRSLVIVTGDSAVVRDARTGELLHRFVPDNGGLVDAQWSPDDRSLYTTSGVDVEEDDLLMTWRVSTVPGVLVLGEDTGRLQERGYDFSLPGPTGRVLARMQAHRLWFVDTGNGRRTAPSRRLPELWGSRWSPDARRFLTWHADETIRVWDAQTGRELAHRRHYSDLLPVAFAPDGTMLYLPDGTGRLETLETDTLRPAHDPVPLGTGIASLLAHPSDGSVTALRTDGSLVRLDPSDGKVLGTAPPGTLPAQARSWVYSPDGSVLATADASGNLRLMDATSLTWAGPDSGAPWGTDRDYAPDGSQVAAVRADRVSLWDGRTGEYLSSLPLPADTGPVSITYRKDSSGLVIAAADGRTWTADTRTETWTERACAIAGRDLTASEWDQFFPGRDRHATCPG